MEVLGLRRGELSAYQSGHFRQLLGRISTTKAQDEERLQPALDHTLRHRYDFLDFQYSQRCFGIGIT